MRRPSAFTLVEMLAVISIMLILMTVAFGMFRLFAERTGPDASLAVIQAAIHNARDYAATNGVPTRIYFRARDSRNETMEGSSLELQYYSAADNDWLPVPGRQAVTFRDRVYVLKGIPSIVSLAGGLPVTDRANPKPQDVIAWRKYEQDVLGKITQHAMSGQNLASEHDGFAIEFGPAGYPPAVPRTPATKLVEEGVTVVKVAGTRVVSYAFYPINRNAGTRLVFD